MALFLNLYIGHLLGDFLFQPGKLVSAKRHGAGGLLLHTAIVGTCCSLLLVSGLRKRWSAILLVVVAHAGIELVTIYTYLGTATRGLFTFLLDQVLHVLSIVVVVYSTGAWASTKTVVSLGVEVSIGTLAAITGLLAVTLMGSILTFEMANAFLLPKGSKGELLAFDVARVAGIIERGVGFVAALFWHPLLAFVPFLPRLLHSSRLTADRRRRKWIELGTGLALVLVAYALFTIVKVMPG